MRRIRKAITAAIGAGVTAGLTAVVTDGALTRAEFSKALGVALVAAVTVGWATYKVPNAGPTLHQ
jgi:hypothetical protein